MTARRTWYAAGLLLAALGVPLIAWFASGWADVRARQRAEEAAPQHEADAKAAELAHELRAELAQLMTREVDRPYFHYQNLMHDPRATGTVGVAPSPLAGAPSDALVLGYFQVDGAGRASTPTINDDVPDLSEPKKLADNQRFRAEVGKSFGTTLLAEAARKPSQVIQIDGNSYTQNWNASSIYQQYRNDPGTTVAPEAAIQARVSRVAPSLTPVAITVAPLAWQTVTFAGAPTLVAVRHVETPDDTYTQGFVVDRTAVTGWLAGHAGDMVAELRTGDEGATEIAPGWHLAVAANPRVVAEAAASAGHVATAFLARFVVLAVIALLAAGVVVLLVAGAERLARERSQFAAAAAHELRTPLAGLQLYGDMLADGLGDPQKTRDYARRMSEEASRLGRVVSNVLGFSQLERGNLSVDPSIGSLDAELRSLAERAEPALDRAGAALALDVAPDLTAKFDRDALARIVGNLLDNAEKYGRAAEDRTIELAARSAGDDAVEVVVTDHGPGVTEQVRPALFQAFKRGVTADGPAGLGLGLALSQSLARAMGGDLDYRPATGGGAAFVLRLPRG